MAVNNGGQIQQGNAARCRDNSETRLRRAQAWVECALALHKTPAAQKPKQMSPQNKVLLKVDDYAVRFVFWWIAFEAVSAQREDGGKREDSGIHQTAKFIRQILKFNAKQAEKLLERHNAAAQKIIALRQTHDGFWINRPAKDPQRTYPSHKKWESDFNKQTKSYENKGVSTKLSILFKRLHVVRNQVFHGANSRSGSRGLTQVRCGVEILAAFVPFFISEIEEHSENNWGDVPFPRHGIADQQDKLMPVWAEEDNENG